MQKVLAFVTHNRPDHTHLNPTIAKVDERMEHRCNRQLLSVKAYLTYLTRITLLQSTQSSVLPSGHKLRGTTGSDAPQQTCAAEGQCSLTPVLNPPHTQPKKCRNPQQRSDLCHVISIRTQHSFQAVGLLQQFGHGPRILPDIF